MTAKQLVQERLPRWSEEQAQRALHAAEQDVPATAENGIASTAQAKQPKEKQPKKVGRLSFFAIGEADPPDGAKRFDELLGLAIDRRHPRS